MSMVLAWLANSLGEPAQAAIRPVKLNWEFGKYTSESGTGDIHYKDAHLVVATSGTVQDAPAPTTTNNGFANGGASVTHGIPDDSITMDWNVGGGAALVGAKAADWKKAFGAQVITAAVLSGVYSLGNLITAQDHQDIIIFWAHDLTRLTDFVTEAS